MEKKVKLSPKQAASLSQIQQQKQQLSNMFQELNQKEALVVDLVLEVNNVDPNKIEDIKLDTEYITFNEKDSTSEPVKKGKVVKAAEPVGK